MPDESESRCYVCDAPADPIGSVFPQRIEFDDGTCLCERCARRLVPERVSAVDLWDDWEAKQRHENEGRDPRSDVPDARERYNGSGGQA